MHSSNIAREEAREMAARWRATAWVGVNLVLSLLIGAALGGQDGAAIGFLLGVVLVKTPDILAQGMRWARQGVRALTPLGLRAMPRILRERIEERGRS